VADALLAWSTCSTSACLHSLSLCHWVAVGRCHWPEPQLWPGLYTTWPGVWLQRQLFGGTFTYLWEFVCKSRSKATISHQTFQSQITTFVDEITSLSFCSVVGWWPYPKMYYCKDISHQSLCCLLLRFRLCVNSAPATPIRKPSVTPFQSIQWQWHCRFCLLINFWC
jgi:hypothetical protein